MSLILEDGQVFRGEGHGRVASALGEVVFTTAMTGYQEVLTDPSYAGQIVVMTYPLIGNYGVDPAADQTERPRVRGFVVRELCDHPSHSRSTQTLTVYLEHHGVPVLAGVDTRALTRRLRINGTMGGMLVPGEPRPNHQAAAGKVNLAGVVDEVTCRQPYELPGPGPHLAVLDFGLKRNILRELSKLGCRLTVFPARTPASEVLAQRPAGAVLTNGPGDPRDILWAAAEAGVLTERLPVLGICLGHQILALALGADTYKLKFGHRGANHPVREEATGRVSITSQNHGYAVAEESLAGTPWEVTHRNLHDGTVEGLRHRHRPVWTRQYHPEASPGPWDERELFARFVALAEKGV